MQSYLRYYTLMIREIRKEIGKRLVNTLSKAKKWYTNNHINYVYSSYKTNLPFNLFLTIETSKWYIKSNALKLKYCERVLIYKNQCNIRLGIFYNQVKHHCCQSRQTKCTNALLYWKYQYKYCGKNFNINVSDMYDLINLSEYKIHCNLMIRWVSWRSVFL